MEWTPEALQAAWEAMFEEPWDGTQAPMIGAGLDAAVKIEFQQNTASVAYQMAFLSGRSEALEEAANVVEGHSTAVNGKLMQRILQGDCAAMSERDFEIAAAIRALK